MIIRVLLAVLAVILLDSQLKKRCNKPVQHIPCTQNGYGDKTPGTPINLLCYAYGKIATVKNVKGDEVVSSLRLLFDGILTIGSVDEFMLDTKSYPLIAFSIFPSLGKDSGVTEVYL